MVLALYRRQLGHDSALAGIRVSSKSYDLERTFLLCSHTGKISFMSYGNLKRTTKVDFMLFRGLFIAQSN